MAQASTLQVGDIVAGKYRIERLIGEGGMARVYAARHQSLDQLVAIKILQPKLVGAQTLERFRREARAAARIRGEHVCRVLDVGEMADGGPFMVMEFLEGNDLSQELQRNGPLAAREAANHVLQACEALAEAHQAGIVHRDLKPGNLFLARGPSGNTLVKVLDFGVSKLMDGATSRDLSLTATSMLVGSPLYMSPEQVDSARDVDVQTDIWALGVVLFELVTGRVPFPAETMPQFVHALLNHEPPTFDSLGVSAPSGFEDVVRRALQKDKRKRYASVADLAAALSVYAEASVRPAALRAASFAPTDGREPTDPAVVAMGSSVSTPVEWERTAHADRGERRLGAVALGLGALVLVGGGIVYWSTLVEGAGGGGTAKAPEAPASVAASLAPPEINAASEPPAVPETLDAGSPEALGAVAEELPEGLAAPATDDVTENPPAVPARIRPALARPRPRRTQPRPQPPAAAPSVPAAAPQPTAPSVPAAPDDPFPDFGGRR